MLNGETQVTESILHDTEAINANLFIPQVTLKSEKKVKTGFIKPALLYVNVSLYILNHSAVTLINTWIHRKPICNHLTHFGVFLESAKLPPHLPVYSPSFL